MVRLGHLRAFSPSNRRQSRQRENQQDRQQGKQENAPPPFPLSQVPVDILNEIASWLPTVSRLCLALTCKGFLTTLDRSQALCRSHTIRLTETEVDPYLIDKNSYFISERARFMSLLHRDLTNDHPRWRCCFDCLMLHHPRAFPALVDWGAYSRSSPVKGSSNYCGKGVVSHGYIVICPCLRLTVRDIERISRRVRQANPPIPRPFHHLLKRRAIEIPLHTCRHQYANTLVDINVSASFADTGDPGSLTLRTAFTLSGTKTKESSQRIPLYICPHTPIHNYINSAGYNPLPDPAPLHRNRPTLPCTAQTFTCKGCRVSITAPEFLRFPDAQKPSRITEHVSVQSVRLMVLDESFPKPLYGPRLFFPRALLGRKTFVGTPNYTLSYPYAPSRVEREPYYETGRLIFSKSLL